jgi:hypothetical protein
MIGPFGCTCGDDVPLCEACRRAAIDVALAVADTCGHTRASAVNEIEYTDPFTGRVSTLRRDPSGAWDVTHVRPLGGVERARCRPPAGHA